MKVILPVVTLLRKKLTLVGRRTLLPFPSTSWGQVCVIFSIRYGYRSHFKGKRKKEGVLITHDMFKFQKNNSSRDLSTWWYTCSHKNSHGCNARAIIKRKEIVGEDGELWVENILVEVATPEVNDWKLLWLLFLIFKIPGSCKIPCSWPGWDTGSSSCC